MVVVAMVYPSLPRQARIIPSWDAEHEGIGSQPCRDICYVSYSPRGERGYWMYSASDFLAQPSTWLHQSRGRTLAATSTRMASWSMAGSAKAGRSSFPASMI